MFIFAFQLQQFRYIRRVYLLKFRLISLSTFTISLSFSTGGTATNILANIYTTPITTRAPIFTKTITGAGVAWLELVLRWGEH